MPSCFIDLILSLALFVFLHHGIWDAFVHTVSSVLDIFFPYSFHYIFCQSLSLPCICSVFGCKIAHQPSQNYKQLRYIAVWVTLLLLYIYIGCILLHPVYQSSTNFFTSYELLQTFCMLYHLISPLFPLSMNAAVEKTDILCLCGVCF